MRVLVCIPCLMTGGTEIQTLSLVSALRAAGHVVCVACYFEHSAAMTQRYRESGADIRLLSPDGRRPDGVGNVTAMLWHGLRQTVRGFRPDIAHVQYMTPGAIPILILRALGVRHIVATAHTDADIYSPRGLKLLKMLNRRLLTAFQCITERAETSFFGAASLFSEHTRLSRRGNHFTIYNNLPSYISIRQTERRRDPLEPLTVGMVSRLEQIKGADLVVPAFAEARGVHPGMRLLIVGDGSLRGLMERQAMEAGVKEVVTFAGRQPQDSLQELYDRMDVLVMPSRSEGFGLTAVEGMARGCVPVVADTGGLPEVVRDGRDGLLHRRGDTRDLALKIGMLAEDQALLDRLSDSSRSRATTFSTDRYNNLITRLYLKLQTS